MAIVLGHIISVYTAHIISLRRTPERSSVLKSQYPMLALMVTYTATSLWIISAAPKALRQAPRLPALRRDTLQESFMLARSSMKTGLLLIVLLSSMAALVACEGGTKEFDLEIRRGALTLAPAVMRVEQHKDVMMSVKTDEVGTFRIVGYGIATELDPAKTVLIDFNAAKSGNFEVTWQGQQDQAETTVAAFDVRPLR